MDKRHPDGGLRPALAAQIDGDEGAEAGLDVGNEQIEPIETASRGGVNRLGARRFGCRPREASAHFFVLAASAASVRAASGGGMSTRGRFESLYSGADCSFSRLTFEDDGFVARGGIEAQQWPVDRDAPGAHAEESAEIDDGDSHPLRRHPRAHRPRGRDSLLWDPVRPCPEST